MSGVPVLRREKARQPMKVLHRLKNEEGIALVTTMMLTLLALTIVSTALYLMAASTKQSGITKSYRTALQASYGASDLVVKDLIPQLLSNADSTTAIRDVINNFPGLAPSLTIEPGYPTQAQQQQCIAAKLNSAPAAWPAGCSSTLRAKELPDFRFTMPASAGATPYTIYSKIVDTVVGNSDMSGVSLLGAGVAEAQSGITPQHIPYVFRVEVQAERSANATENAALSVLYAY